MDINNPDIEKIREEFPILKRNIYKHPLVYLDNTATSQAPNSVVDAIVSGYTRTKANVHRGVHTLSMEATELQESARIKVKDFINAPSVEEIIFTRGTTGLLYTSDAADD
ncbi:MAG: aminotransferase class V-fold PLP-dependent enzyme, partial [Duncaniella sp.]|nr:aminotransferase class V-fold PLP-dependent enzyme [Duncaniella sp.]